MITNAALHSINFVNAGSKAISINHKWITVHKGDMYFIPATAHIQEGPTSMDFQEQSFLFTSDDLQQAVFRSIALYGYDLNMPETTPVRYHYAADFGVKTFFQAERLYGSNLLADTPNLKNIKLNELLGFIIASQQNGATEVMRTILRQVDQEECQFKAIISKHIFENLTIDELAALTNKSLTAFKNYFQRILGETPHRWIIKQRLLHARILTTSTKKAISQISYECRFDNISHFIKLFKREFGKTPLSMRQELNLTHNR